MVDIAESARFSPREDLVLEEIEDEVVILDLKSNSYFGLNPVARLVWKGIDDGKPVAEIIESIAEQFDVERHEVADDVRGFLGDALSNGLVTEQ
jgi:hypothetical protein